MADAKMSARSDVEVIPMGVEHAADVVRLIDAQLGERFMLVEDVPDLVSRSVTGNGPLHSSAANIAL